MQYSRYKFIGYKKDEVIQSIGEKTEIIIKMTQTPFKDKIEERVGSEPIVIKQKEDNGKLILTVTRFK